MADHVANSCTTTKFKVSIQTCQGPEMKMRETVRHSGEGAIFFRESTACDAAFI